MPLHFGRAVIFTDVWGELRVSLYPLVTREGECAPPNPRKWHCGGSLVPPPTLLFHKHRSFSQGHCCHASTTPPIHPQHPHPSSVSSWEPVGLTSNQHRSRIEGEVTVQRLNSIKEWIGRMRGWQQMNPEIWNAYGKLLGLFIPWVVVVRPSSWSACLLDVQFFTPCKM